MKNRSKILLALLIVLTLTVGMFAITAGAEGDTKTVYLEPGPWETGGAWYAAWSWQGSESGSWYTMVDSDYDGVYEVDIPSSDDTIIFVRMNPSYSSPNWDGKWNQTGNITLSTDGKDLFTITSWDNQTTGWSEYVAPTFTVAGSTGLCGTDWTPADVNNDMTSVGEGIYKKVYTNVSAGSYEFKVAKNHAWDASWPSANYSLTVANDASTVIITFDLSTKTVSADVVFPAGSGTEDDPWLISSIEELVWFRDQVNSGNSYDDQYIKLVADIDLTDVEWTPIGTSACTFNGMFDGGDHVISNLTVSGDKTYVRGGTNDNCKGLFGYMKGGNNAGIKNITLNNVSVTGCLYVGTILGRSYTGGIIENCHVEGLVQVDGYSYAGGIVGRDDYSEGANANGDVMAIYNCSVDGAVLTGNGESFINADYEVSYVGGIVGFVGEGDYVIEDCSVSNISVQGVYGVGGISGIAHYGNTISNASVDSVTVVSTNNDPENDRTGNVGLIAGATQGTEESPSVITGTVTNTSGSVAYTDATTAAITSIYGTNIDSSSAVTNYVARIGDNYYESLSVAFADGGEIVLLRDVTLDTAINVSDGVTLDLGDNTLYINVENSYYNNVTIQNGNIVLGKDDVHACDGYFIVNAGKTLTLNGVNLSSSEDGIKGYAVFHLKTGAGVELIGCDLSIANNEYEAGYIVYAGEDTATVTIVDSTVVGDNVNGIVHANTVIDNSEITIDAYEHGINRSGVSINDSTVTIYDGFGRGITAQHGALNVTGNSTVTIFNMDEATIELRGDQSVTIAEGATVKLDAAISNTTNGTVSGEIVEIVVVSNADGSYELVNAAATVNGTYYTTIEDALDAAVAGDNVTILACDYTGNLSVNKAITVIGETDAEGNNLVNIAGKLNITADGATVKNLNINNGTSSAGYISAKDILVESCTVVGGNGFRSCYTKGLVTFKNCVITGATYGIHFDGSAGGEIVIDGCTITGWTSFARTITKVSMINTSFEEGNYNYIRFYQDEVIIDGCYFNEKMVVDIATAAAGANVTVNNCTVVNGSVENLFADDDLISSNIVVNEERLLPLVALINGAEFRAESIYDAFDAAVDGDTVALVKNVELTEVLNITKKLTVEGNGFVITQADSFDNTIAAVYITADATINNVVFDGINGGAAIRTLKSNIVIDKCVFRNCDHTTVGQGLLRLTYGSATITDTEFLNNNCPMVITFNWDADTNEVGDEVLTIDNCLFENNTANKTAVVYYVGGAGCSITDSEFKNNTVNCNQNGATVYLGFQNNCTVTGCLFESNSVTDSSSSTRVAGAIFFGYEAKISGNAFVNNTAANANGDTLGQICTSTYYECAIDLSGNYWGGQSPVAGVDYTVQHQNGAASFTLDNYNASYTIDEDGNVVVGDETEIVYAVTAGKLQYVSIADAIAAGGEITLNSDLEITEKLVVNNNVVINLAGKTLSYVSDVKGESMIVVNGSLTIIDSTTLIRTGSEAGSISYVYTGEPDSTYSTGNYTIANNGTLTINGGVIEVSAQNVEGKIPHALYAINNAGTLIINGGKIYNANNTAIRNWNDADITVNGGEIEGVRAIWIQLPGTDAAVAPEVNITITGGTLIGTGVGESYDNKLAIYSYSYGNDMQNVTLNISGGTFNGDIALTGGSNKTNIETVNISDGIFNGAWGEVYSYGDDDKAVAAITITGGTFATDAAEMYAEDDGFMFIANSEGTYSVLEKAVSAPSIGEDGNWYIGDVNTGIKAEGIDGNGIEKTELVEIEKDGVKGLYIQITYTSGDVVTIDVNLKGDKGETGNGIANVELTDDFMLVITYTDGTTTVLGPIRGQQGETGNGIASITLNESFELVITYTDGTPVNLGSIKGEKGDKGETGNGIASITLNESFELVITYTDGTSVNLGSIKGEKGDKGDKGDTGATGAAGNNNDQIVKIAMIVAVSSIVIAAAVVLVRNYKRKTWWGARR